MMNSWLIKIAVVIVMLGGIVVGLIEPPNPFYVPPVQAATPADPVVVPCVEINTAAVTDDMVIKIFRCQPETGAPYLLNSFGFMKDEE